MEYLTTTLILSVILCQTSFVIGSSLMLIALATDITNELHSINVSNGNRLKLTKTLNESIELHSDAKKYFQKQIVFQCMKENENKMVLIFYRLIQKFYEAYEFNITIHFLWGIVTICGILLMIQMELVEYYLTSLLVSESFF